MDIKNETQLINEYNKLVDNIDKSKNSIDILKEFTEYQWTVFIAGKTYKFGRSWIDSIENAKSHLTDSIDIRIKRFAYKHNE